jgi:transposase
VVGCALLTDVEGKVTKERAEFPTMAAGLAKLVAWLSRLGVKTVCMESTGVYWMPVFAALERAGGFDQWVVNAQHVKAVPGRKTDVKDAEWLAYLVRHGLVRKSFVPDKPFRDLRDLTRYRRVLVDAQASERRRLIRQLELAGIKLAGVMSDVLGVSGRAILRAIIDGQESATLMARLAVGHLRRKRPQLIDALSVPVAGHHRRLLAIQLGRVEAAEAEIAALDGLIGERLEPYAEPLARLMTIPGIDRVGAATLIAEIGVDLSSFPTAHHLAAWAGVCPGNNQSGGKSKPAVARKGNPHLKTALCNAAIGASRTRGSYLKTKYHKLKSRRGGGRAALAIGHKLLVCAYHILTKGTVYRDLGEAYLDQRDSQRTTQRYVRRLEKLGYTVALTPRAEKPHAAAA